MQITPVLGTLIAFCSILIGQWIGGGSVFELMQFGSALVVLGGTVGATLLAFPIHEIRRAMAFVPALYTDGYSDLRPLITEIVGLAEFARREGVLAIEGQRAGLKSEGLRRAARYIAEGVEPQTVGAILEGELQRESDQTESAGRVFETAGAYAPTIGVVGAILGLIQVMSHLNDPSKIGSGIAGAFVSMIYGVGFSSFILVPWSTRVRRLGSERLLNCEVIRCGVLAIMDGLNPIYIQERLDAFLPTQGKKPHVSPTPRPV